jgi:hypothetical protein
MSAFRAWAPCSLPVSCWLRDLLGLAGEARQGRVAQAGPPKDTPLPISP